MREKLDAAANRTIDYGNIEDHVLLIVTLDSCHDIQLAESDRYSGPVLSNTGTFAPVRILRTFHMASHFSFLEPDFLIQDIKEFMENFGVREDPENEGNISGSVVVAFFGLGPMSTKEMAQPDNVTKVLTSLATIAKSLGVIAIQLGHGELPVTTTERGKFLATLAEVYVKNSLALSHNRVFIQDIFTPLTLNKIRRFKGADGDEHLGHTGSIIPYIKRLMLVIKLALEFMHHKDDEMQSESAQNNSTEEAPANP
jgi:hypothetical protein